MNVMIPTTGALSLPYFCQFGNHFTWFRIRNCWFQIASLSRF